MKFGVFDHLDASGAPLDQFFEDRLKLIEAYERAGIYSYHTAEHHATPLGMAPSPSLLHAAIAQRTRTLRFGPLVYTLNLYHPLRLAEEICMLDHMSRGRLQLGIGRGISPHELRYFGTDPAKGQAMYIEAFEVIRQALTTDRLTHEGEYYQFRDVPIVMHPYQKPHPPLWYGIGNPASVPWCVENRVNVLSNAPATVMRPITDQYRQAWRAAGHADADLPLMGTTRHMVIAPTDQEALAIARRGYKLWYDAFIYLWNLNGGTPPFANYGPDFDQILARGQAIVGSPATVRAQIAQQVGECGANYLLCRFAFGDLTLAESMRSLELFARDVMPAFR